jgi:serine/threonine protein kinase
MEKMNYQGILDNKYYLLKKVGSGGTSRVYLGFNNEDKSKLLAIKVNKDESNDKFFDNESQMLEKINHPNVIRIIESGQGFLVKTSGTQNFVKYIVLEYLKNGELFDYVYFPQHGFGEKFGRLIFLTILNAVEAAHQVGIVHRDLKTENFMVSENFDIKLADFGFATNKEGKEGNGLLSTFLGTAKYAAPELLAKVPYFGICNDIYSLGIVLFVLVTKGMPFGAAVDNDSYYSFVFNCDYEGYWKRRFPSGNPLTQSFRDLFQNMIALDSTQRPSIDEIRSHPWVQEGLGNLEEGELLLKKEMKRRKTEIDAKKGFDGTLPPSDNKPAAGLGRVYRSGSIKYGEKSPEDIILAENVKELRKYVETGNKTVIEFCTKNKPEQIMQLVIEFFDKKKAGVKLSEKRMKVVVEISDNTEIESEELTIRDTKIACEVVENDDSSKYILEFDHLSGDRYLTYELFQEFFDSIKEKANP